VKHLLQARHLDTAPAGGSSATAFDRDARRWQAVVERDPRADGAFFYGVSTTGVFCRPSCGARTPLQKNVSFYREPSEAKRAGFRACKRCNPESTPPRQHQKELVVEACRRIERSETEPSLTELSNSAGLSPHHFNRVFKRIVGVTPKQYAIAHRSRVASKNLTTSKSVTSAIYESGYGASSRFYESAQRRHGMTATDIRKGGNGIVIRHAFRNSSLGLVAVAATEKGLCAVLFGASEQEVIEDLKHRFPNAFLEVAEAGSDFERWVDRTVDYVDGASRPFDIPLDVRGTAFQELVWRALRDIPEGHTASYAEVAERIGRPGSARAVAGACAANPMAVLIPCHRVLRSDGGLSGYRWGANRKRELLERESMSSELE
jgi:AraC family transcriptional regulator, regulatory protein of adaptative response / methylated-DNA-[protein]-cysteine methyltransferase